MHGVFEITVERLDIPAHVIEIGQFGSRKQTRIQQRGNQAAAAKPLTINEKHPDDEKRKDRSRDYRFSLPVFQSETAL